MPEQSVQASSCPRLFQSMYCRPPRASTWADGLVATSIEIGTRSDLEVRVVLPVSDASEFVLGPAIGAAQTEGVRMAAHQSIGIAEATSGDTLDVSHGRHLSKVVPQKEKGQLIAGLFSVLNSPKFRLSRLAQLAAQF